MNGQPFAPGPAARAASSAPLGHGTLHTDLAEREGPASLATVPERPVVLVVDDFEPVRVLLARYLDRMGFRMIAVGDARGAIEALEAERVDHVLLDVNLPGGSRRVYEHIRETKNGLRERTAFITGGFVEDDSEAFVRETGCPALFKPFDLHQLRALFQS